MMMSALLSKSIRDAYGRLHKRDEPLTIMSRLPRADFDTRPLLKVRFQDGSTGLSLGKKSSSSARIRYPPARSTQERFCHSRRGVKNEAEAHFRQFLDV